MRKAPFECTIAYDAEIPARKLLLEKYNKKATSFADLEKKIKEAINEKGDEAKRDFAMLHPDRDLILSTAPVIEPIKIIETKEVQSNACGCSSGFNAEQQSNCSGSKSCNCGGNANNNNKGNFSSYDGGYSGFNMTKEDSTKIVTVLGVLGIIVVAGIILKK